jgi:hypothetical protein
MPPWSILWPMPVELSVAIPQHLKKIIHSLAGINKTTSKPFGGSLKPNDHLATR